MIYIYIVKTTYLWNSKLFFSNTYYDYKINITIVFFCTYVYLSWRLGHQSSFHHQMIAILIFSSGDKNSDLDDDRTRTLNIT